MFQVQTGIDILLADSPDWMDLRIALVTNHAATTSTFIPSRQALLEKGFNIIKLFSPEHGLDTTGADGQEMPGGSDPLTGLPIVSLYGEKLAPDAQDLADIDLVLFDIPDVGVRFYTYLWTMTHVMESCAAHSKPLVIADRPNPLSGSMDLAEGPMLDEVRCSSFIGRWNIPLRHSCTLGELAAFFNMDRGIGCPLQIVACRHWNRSMFHPDYSHSFVPTSPAIPDFGSALLYPGLGLLEATNISEGRGSSTPFRVAGAPWMSAAGVAARFNRTASSAIIARPVHFTPLEGTYTGRHCKGVMLHVQDRSAFRPVAAGLLLIRIILDMHPDHFRWAAYPTYVNSTGGRHLDLLTGMNEAEQVFETCPDAWDEAGKITEAGNWKERISEHLLYT